MVFQLQTNSLSKLKKSWFFKNIFFLYEFLSKIQIGFDYHRTWWYQFFRYFLCKIFSPEISCDFDLSSSRSSLRSLAENMKRYMVLVCRPMLYLHLYKNYTDTWTILFICVPYNYLGELKWKNSEIVWMWKSDLWIRKSTPSEQVK